MMDRKKLISRQVTSVPQNPQNLAIGNEISIKNFNTMNTKNGKITLLTPTDCVKDRLAAYYHWNDPQSFEQALLVAKKQKINIKNIELWSKKESKLKEFRKFQKELESD